MKGNLIKFLLPFLCLSTVPEVRGRSYSYHIQLLNKLASIDLQVVQWLTKEQEKAQVVKTTVNDKILSDISNYIKDFHDGCGKVVSSLRRKDAKTVAENPICAYRLIRRFASSLQPLLVNTLSLFESPKNLIPEEVFDMWPTINDLHEAMDGILRSQQIDNLPAAELARGKIADTETGASLSLDNCIEVAEYALDNKEYSVAIEWALAAKSRPNVGPLTKWTKEMGIKRVEDLLETAIIKHDEAFATAKEVNLNFFDRPIKANVNYTKLTEIEDFPNMRRETVINKYKNDANEPELIQHAICRGYRFKTKATKSRLFCWFEHKRHPLFYIGPVRMELISRDPDVLIVHRFLGPKFMRKMKRRIGDRLLTQNLPEGPDNTIETDDRKKTVNDRFSSLALLDDKSESSKFKQVPQLVKILTGLNSEKGHSSDELYVKSYTFAGIIGLHNDSQGDRKNGTYMWRIATALFYLSNVKKGGETVFPIPGIVVTPKAGSVLFFFTAYADGSTDPLMVHASCPTLIGSKWIMNKGISYEGQFPNWKCPKQPKQRFRVLPNGKWG